MDNFLPKALMISLMAHTLIVGSGYLINVNQAQPKKVGKKGVEISIQSRKKSASMEQHPIKRVQQLDLKSEIPLVTSGNIPVKLAKEHQMTSPFAMYERKPEHVRSLQSSHRVTITPIKSEKINNPAYAAFSEMVRSRIREKLYMNYDKDGVGNVYLTFVVDKSGNLKAAQIIAEKTTAPFHLQQTSLESLKQASPFPMFLKGMTLPEYTFNIEIQYQIND